MNPIQGGAPGSYGTTPAATNAMNAMPRTPHQFMELLDHIRTEYENLANENKTYRGMREEFQRKVEEQVTELNAMEQMIVELDRKHHLMKDQFEAEVIRLKGQQSAIQTSAPGPTGTPVSGQMKRSPAVPNPSAPAPETSGQMPSYQNTLQGVFSNRGGPAQPSGLPQQPNQQAPNQPAKLTPRMVNPPTQPQPQPQGSTRLMGIASLPSASPTASMHPVGATAPTITALTPGAPPVSRAPTKMHAMGMIPSTAGPDVNPMGGHPMKKEAGSTIPSAPGPVVGTSTPAAPFGQVAVRQSDAATTAPFNGISQQAPNEDDWVVYQGRSANGAVVNMKVALQNSFMHDSVVCCVRYSWDGQYLATGSNRSAHIFDAATGQSVAVFSKDDGGEMDEGAGSDSYVRAVCFSPDGNWLITGAEDHVVKVWDVRNRTVRHKLVGHDTDIYSVDASADSQFIISGSGDKKAKLWSLESGKLISTLGGEYGPTDGITSVSVSPTSQHVAAGSLDKIVRVWDVQTSRLLRQFAGHRDSVYSVAFSPDGRMLLSGSLDRSLRLWDLAAAQATGQCRLSFTGHKDFVLSVAFSPNGRWLISGSKDRTVQFWDPRQSNMCLQLQGHKNSVISIAHNPRTKSLATGSGDCRARTWTYT